jgi:hypothetical protein
MKQAPSSHESNEALVCTSRAQATFNNKVVQPVDIRILVVRVVLSLHESLTVIGYLYVVMFWSLKLERSGIYFDSIDYDYTA